MPAIIMYMRLSAYSPACEVIQTCHLCRCSAGNGGAAFIAGTSATSVTLVNITSSSLVDNSAVNTDSSGVGGGIYVDGGVSVLSNNSLTGNTAGGYGGGLAYRSQCFNSSSVPGVYSLPLAGSICRSGVHTCLPACMV